MRIVFKDKESKSVIHIIVQLLTLTTELGRKRTITEITEEETTSRKRRSWAVNSTIMNEVRDSVYFVGPTEASGPLYNMIQKGEFVALYGARASGKSTRVDQAMIKLESEGYVCIIYLLKDMMHYLEQMMTLNPRNIKNSKRYYALWSSVAIGSLSILFLKSDKINVSPFSVKEPFRNPNFTLAQVESLYKDYEDDAKLTIVPEVIKDINERTNGHAGLVARPSIIT
ncbi:unnamed protein product [Rhizophagus irregularis]|nr:unnamed protein product [Rhizophagus irregularis]